MQLILYSFFRELLYVMLQKSRSGFSADQIAHVEEVLDLFLATTSTISDRWYLRLFTLRSVHARSRHVYRAFDAWAKIEGESSNNAQMRDKLAIKMSRKVSKLCSAYSATKNMIEKNLDVIVFDQTISGLSNLSGCGLKSIGKSVIRWLSKIDPPND